MELPQTLTTLAGRTRRATRRAWVGGSGGQFWRLDDEDLADVIAAHGMAPTPEQVAQVFGVEPSSPLVSAALHTLSLESR